MKFIWSRRNGALLIDLEDGELLISCFAKSIIKETSSKSQREEDLEEKELLEGQSPVVFFKFVTFCCLFFGSWNCTIMSNIYKMVWGEGMYLFCSNCLCSFFFTLLTNLHLMIKNKIIQCLHKIFIQSTNQPTFHSEKRLVNLARGRECFVGLSI